MQASQASKILGSNFFGWKEWSYFYGATDLELPEFPWEEEILNSPCPFDRGKKVFQTHLAFLGLPTIKRDSLTISKWREIHLSGSLPCFNLNIYKEPLSGPFFERTTCQPRWYLMPINALPGSEGKPFRQQREMVPSQYQIPFAVEEVAKVFLLFVKKGECANPRMYARCQDVTDKGERVDIGFFSKETGLDIFFSHESEAKEYIGLALSMRV